MNTRSFPSRRFRPSHSGHPQYGIGWSTIVVAKEQANSQSTDTCKMSEDSNDENSPHESRESPILGYPAIYMSGKEVRDNDEPERPILVPPDEPDQYLRMLQLGDPVIWDGRTDPLTVVDTSFGSHVMLKGPQGDIYRVEPPEEGDEGGPTFLLARRGKQIHGFRFYWTPTDSGFTEEKP